MIKRDLNPAAYIRIYAEKLDPAVKKSKQPKPIYRGTPRAVLAYLYRFPETEWVELIESASMTPVTIDDLKECVLRRDIRLMAKEQEANEPELLEARQRRYEQARRNAEAFANKYLESAMPQLIEKMERELLTTGRSWTKWPAVMKEMTGVEPLTSRTIEQEALRLLKGSLTFPDVLMRPPPGEQ